MTFIEHLRAPKNLALDPYLVPSEMPTHGGLA